MATVSPVFLRDWMVALRPVRDKLLTPLSVIFRDPQRREAERSLATELLAEYAADQPAVLAERIQDADEAQFAVIFPRLQAHSATALPLLKAELKRTLEPELQCRPPPRNVRKIGPGQSGWQRVGRHQW